MKTYRRFQIIVATIGLITALSMCGNDANANSENFVPAFMLVLLSGVMLLNYQLSANEEREEEIESIDTEEADRDNRY